MKKLLIASIGLASVFMACSDDDGASSISTNSENRRVVGGDSILVEKGYFTDFRDGNKYKVAKINGDYWLAENLRYMDSSKTENLKGNVWCYDDDSKNCEKYGTLYSWAAAMDFDSKYNSEEVGIQDDDGYDICPDGWGVPTFTQWKNFFEYIDNANGSEDNGTSLKSVKGWDESDTIPGGTNRFGFNALAAGRHNSEGGFLPDGKNAFFWTHNEVDAATAKGVSLRFNSKFADHGEYYKDHGMSVRCVAKKPNLVKVDGDLDSAYVAEIPFDYGSMKVDTEKYKTIKIGNQTWMAENLNYKTGDSWCYDDKSDNCDKFGRLYNWETAQKVCPEGWKLPSKKDVEELMENHSSMRFFRSKDGWKGSEGLNFWGFDAIAAGAYNETDAAFFDKTISAYFWASDEDSADSDMAYALFISYSDKVEVKTFEKQLGYSVRCVKD